MSANSKVTLEMTVEQAAAIAHMLDLATRIHLCQFSEIEWLSRLGYIKHRLGHNLNQDDWGHIEVYADHMKSVFGFPSNASFGIGSPHVSKDAHRGYEVKKVLEKALAEHRDPNPKGLRGVNYDGLVVRYTDDPVPVAAVVKQED